MRKRLLLLALLGMAASAWAMNSRYSSGTAGISVTQANTDTTITDNHSGGTAAAFGATFGTICSRSASANSCFADFDGVATTADWRIEPGACLQFTYAGTDGLGYTHIGAICAAAETATFDIKAAR